MKKCDVIDFFDSCALWWDEDMKRNEEIISQIFDNSRVGYGVNVLDVACGTGVLFPDYLNRNVASLTAIDISPKMVEIAKRKFPEIQVICADVESYDFRKKFDVVMVYNAFPHFPNPENLIKVLAGLTKSQGRLSVAHSMSREALKEHHKRAEQVSIELPEASDLAKLFEPYFDLETIVSNDKMYQVVGIRK